MLRFTFFLHSAQASLFFTYNVNLTKGFEEMVQIQLPADRSDAIILTIIPALSDDFVLTPDCWPFGGDDAPKRIIRYPIIAWRVETKCHLLSEGSYKAWSPSYSFKSYVVPVVESTIIEELAEHAIAYAVQRGQSIITYGMDEYKTDQELLAHWKAIHESEKRLKGV